MTCFPPAFIFVLKTYLQEEYQHFLRNLFYQSIVVYQSDLFTYVYTHTHTHTHIYILFHILFHYGLSHDIKYSSLCYTVGTGCLPIINRIVCIC